MLRQRFLNFLLFLSPAAMDRLCRGIQGGVMVVLAFADRKRPLRFYSRQSCEFEFAVDFACRGLPDSLAARLSRCSAAIAGV